MPRAHQGVDWEAGERHFVEQTGPQVTLREYATMTSELTWTNRQYIGYQQLRDVAKRDLWIKRRAQFLYETRPGLTENVEIIYSIVVHQILDCEEKLDPLELSRLTAQFLQLHDRMLAQRPLDVSTEDQERLTRDGVIDIIKHIKPLTDDDLLEAAAEIMERVKDVGH